MSETVAYNEHVNLIRMMSWKFSKRYEMEFDEVFSEFSRYSRCCRLRC